MSELSCWHGSEEYEAYSDDVLAAHLMSLLREVCACNAVYSIFKDQVGEKYIPSLTVFFGAILAPVFMEFEKFNSFSRSSQGS